jgi:hypothetical protein
MFKAEPSGNCNKLYTFHEGWDYKFVKKRGLPREIETLVKDKTGKEQGPGIWSLYIPGYHEYSPSGEYAFPKELYFEVPANNKIFFDFLGWSHKVRIVSESMLRFLSENGLNDGYEVSLLKVISRNGKAIETEKKYFALRFNLLDDNLLDFQEGMEVEGGSQFKTKFTLYPNMRVKENVTKKIFIIEERTFHNSLVFTESIKRLIEEHKFITPDIYAMNELYKAFID